MKFLHQLFPAGHFIIGVLFLLSAAALIVVGALQLWHGLQFFAEGPITVRLNAVLEAIAVLTVAVAALELGQTLLEEEVQREAQMSAPTRVRRFLSRFMVVLVVSLSIETLVLTFRLSQESPEYLPYAAAVGATASLLLASWGLFIWFNRAAEQLEPEAMQAAKREDRKIEKATKGEGKP